MDVPVQLVGYVDGSTRPSNPGYSGYGIYGYTLTPSKRPNKTKHPSKAKYNFTSSGLSPNKDVEPYETLQILECIGSLSDDKGTNNLAEMRGVIKLLSIAETIERLTRVTVLTDSEYVVSNHNDNLKTWKSNGWVKTNGKTVAHVDSWAKIDELVTNLTNKGVEVILKWVKGHCDDHGNNLADLYANIGSNHARQQLTNPKEPFKEELLLSFTDYKDYKDRLGQKDLVFHFRDLFFSSAEIDDTSYCFLTTSKDPEEMGRQTTSSVFLANVGFVPDIINQVKRLYRGIPRGYTVCCCIKLNRIEDRELLRLAEIVGIDKLVYPVQTPQGINLHLVRDVNPFVLEYSYDFPYTVEASKIFGSALDKVLGIDNMIEGVRVVDVTETFMREGKLAFSNKENNIDLTPYFENHHNLTSLLLATVGYDMPSYLALKTVEPDILSVHAITELKPAANYLSLYIAIKTKDRTLCSVNITNKYLLRPF